MKTILQKIILGTAVMISSFLANAQVNLSCGLDNAIMNARAKNPDYDQQMAEQEKLRDQWKVKYSNSTHAVVTVPVVVHVVWNTAQQNVSDSQIVSQINVLNQDFRRMNSDTVNTPLAFQTIAVDPQIEFCLAQRDPQGNPTNGITRTQTSKTTFFSFSLPPYYIDTSIWYTSLGGFDGWDTAQYLNIWVCELGFYGGIGFWPGGTSLMPGSKDGVLMNFVSFGTMGSAVSPYNLGRTATHEVGHYLDLHHLWGDVSNNSNCLATDYCNDTPTQVQATQGACPTFPKIDGCTTGGNGIMWMNYMDYTYDNCRNMFTADQSARMNSCLAGARASLLSSLACTPPVGVNEVLQMNDVSVFPNPSNGKFTIQSLKDKIERVEIVDVFGKFVEQKMLNTNSGTLSTDLSRGVYSVKIYSGGNSIVKKIIIE